MIPWAVCRSPLTEGDESKRTPGGHGESNLRRLLKFHMRATDMIVRHRSQMIGAMVKYPEPQDIGIPIPRTLIKDRFRSGFRHALKGGQLNRVEYFRLSFREGFRAGKLYLRELRRSQGIVNFPLQGKMRFRARF